MVHIQIIYISDPYVLISMPKPGKAGRGLGMHGTISVLPANMAGNETVVGSRGGILGTPDGGRHRRPHDILPLRDFCFPVIAEHGAEEQVNPARMEYQLISLITGNVTICGR